MYDTQISGSLLKMPFQSIVKIKIRKTISDQHHGHAPLRLIDRGGMLVLDSPLVHTGSPHSG